MSIILGFGSTEKDFEQQEFSFIKEFIKDKAASFKGDKYDFGFTEEIIKELKNKLEERKEHYRKLYEEYKIATNYPERYSTYYFNVLNDNTDLCVIFKFSHINRRHPFSPDGWAMIQETKVFYINVWDCRE